MVNLYFNQGVPKVNIEIDVFKGQSAVAEDFNRARVFLWLVSEYDKTLLSCVASNGKITGSFVQGDDFTLEAGVYSIKAIWIKDDKREELVRPYDQHREGTKMCMTEVKNAFVITSYSEDKTHGAEAEINLKYEARVATYGYDGLSAYEIACIYWPNNTALSEKEWVKIRAAEIETNQIKDKAITTEKIADEAVTTAKINDGAVTKEKIANGNVVTQKIADGNVTTAKIADSNVTTQKIADGNVITSKIADGAVTTGKIKDANVVTAKIADAAVITDKLANGAVTTEKIVDSNVTTSKIDNGAVTETKIKDDAVTNEKIADGAVNTDQIEDGAVTTEKIKDEAVTEDKIGTGEVTTSKIKDDAVTTEKIKDGEVSTDNIAAGAVTEDKIKYGAVTETKIGAGAVTEEKIKDGNVATGKIADGAVTTGKIADGAVTMAKLADGAITDDKIADGALSTFETEQSERLTDLAQKVDDISNIVGIKADTNPNYATIEELWYYSSGSISQNGGKGIIIPVSSGDVVNVDIGVNTDLVKYLWLDEHRNAVEGETRKELSAATGLLHNLEVIEGAKYLWLSYEYYGIEPHYVYKYNSIKVDDVSVFDKYKNIDNPYKLNYPKCVVKYSVTNHSFEIYQNIGGGNKYIMLIVSLRDNRTSDVDYKYLWCLTGGGYYEYDNGVFTPYLQGVITGTENEFTFKLSGARDYTGGYHGDERIDIDPKCYAKFLIDGYECSLESNFLIECNSFSYIQLSSLHNTTAEGTSTDHTKIAYHLKSVDFVDGGANINNVVKFTENVSIAEYFTGLYCMKKNVGRSFIAGGVSFDADDSVNKTYASADFIDNKCPLVRYYNNNNKVGAIVESKLIRGGSEESNISHIQIWSRGGSYTDKDNKYYRFTNFKSKNSGDIIETEMRVRYFIYQ